MRQLSTIGSSIPPPPSVLPTGSATAISLSLPTTMGVEPSAVSLSKGGEQCTIKITAANRRICAPPSKFIFRSLWGACGARADPTPTVVYWGRRFALRTRDERIAQIDEQRLNRLLNPSHARIGETPSFDES